MKTISTKVLFITSTMVLCFLAFLYLNAYVFKYTYLIISFFQELLTIPVLLLEVCLFVFAIEKSRKIGFSSDGYLLGSFAFLTLSILFSFGPILMAIFS